MPINPNSVKWDATPQLDESQIKWDDTPASPSKGFKSGEAFKDTKNLSPDLKGLWEQFKKEWENRANTPMTPEIAAKMMQDEHAAGSGILDTVGALPAMVVGGVHGVLKGVKELDASKGLHAAEETMHKLLPSTILGNEEDQKREGYSTAMAPVTAIMDTLNAVPQGFGEAINAAGFPNAAQQVTDAGKLGIMVGGGALGVKGIHDSITGSKASKGAKEADSKLKDLDRQPKIKESEVKWDDTTAAHADDFAAINPYDLGGHVSELQAGRESVIDNAQGDLFGSHTLEEAQPAPRVGQESIMHDTIPYEKTFPFGLEPMDQKAPRTEMGLNMPEVDQQLSLVPKEELAAPQAPVTNRWENGPIGSRDAARAKAAESQRQAEAEAAEKARIEREKQEAFAYIEQMNKASKEREMNHMEAQRELDFADSVSNIENSTARNFFTDPNNREKAVRPEDSHAKSFFLDPANRDKVDLHEAPTRVTTTLKNGEQVHLEVHHKWNGDHGQGAIIARDAHGNEVGFMAFAKVEEANGTRHNPHVEVEPHMQRKGVATAMYDLAHKVGAKIPREDQFGQARTDAGQAFRTAYGKDHHFGENVLGDKTMMHPEATGTMVEALQRGDVHAALDAIAKNHDNVAYRNLADYLKGQLDGIRVKLHDEGVLTLGDRHATGYYDPTTRTVGFSRVGAASPHTVLHELVHAMTSDFVNTRPNDLRVMGLKDLYNKLSEMGMQKEFPEVSNVKEFLAEAFSSPEFQDFLKQHKLYERSTWRRFVDNVKSMLGFSSSTRNHITDALEHTMDLGKQVMDAGKEDPKAPLTDAGMPSKLADLMVTRQNRPKPVNNPDVTRLKVPGLKDAISDFKFDDRPMGEIIEEARNSPDIPNTMLEKLGQQLQAGGLFESLKTRNPVVKATYERVTRASQEYARNIKEYLTHPETGLKAYMRALNPQEKGEIHAAMMLTEGVREMSNHELRERGFNDKQIAYYNKAREQDNRFFNEINQRRAELGMEPIDKRVAHMAGRFMGDFARFVFDKDGKKIIGRIAGNTKWELDRVTKYMQEQHPEAQMGKLEYSRLGKGKNPGDRFNGLMEALNFLTKSDADVAKVMESYRGYLQKDAVGYLNATRHAKAKVKEAGGIIGSEGNKPWMDTIKNAEEGMKAQLAYFEQGYKWMAMEKAVHDLKPMLGDEKLALNTPNAIKWGRDYLNHALDREQGPLNDAANWTASVFGQFTGIGHTNMFKVNAKIKHVTMQKFMGLLNIPFSITQLMQPFQVHPPMMALLKNRGLEFSATEAQVKATRTYLNAITGEKTGKLEAFDKSALDYAERMGIMDVKMADHTKDINQSLAYEAYSKIADLNIEIPEKLTRGTSFLFYSHILKDAGVPMKDIFGAAENLTNMTMVNYHPIERPMGYAKLGWIGDIASTLTRYKHNQLSQAAFYTREGIHSGNVKGYAPLAAFVGTSLAFGGVMGFFAYNEADTAYQLITKWAGKPDSLTNVLFQHNTPELITHGLFSTLGLDMTSRFSNANLIPNSIGEAIMPYGSAVLDMMQSTGRLAMDPTSTTKQKQFVKSMAPQSVQGLLENQMFTEKQPDGRNLYVNGTNGPNMGKGRVYRSDADMSLRNFGFRNIRESKELAKNYSDSQIEKGNGEVVDRILMKVKYDAMDGTLTTAKLQQYAQRAAQLGEDPGSFVGKLASWEGARHLSQEEQQKLKNAMGGFKGAVNIKEGR